MEMERKFTPEIQELIDEVSKELGSLSEEEFSRLLELSKAGAPCDFRNKQEFSEFLKKVKGEKT